ncbi:glycosyltransferase [Rhabdothermincola salaria]|uniref:glycosyltransferase n=1 Tax=Rhabdothermincola salaria TaxID=2903142 RepID=UPI001E61B701|nr:glycosyltransferase family 2 protein [Rhabdothermincola salaria]
MPQSRPFVRVVVLNFNGGTMTAKCVEHLRRVHYPDDRYEIVVVDNASADDSLEAIRQRFPEVEIRANTVNGGFPANNLAMRDLEGVDHVALINNDAFVEPGWLAALVDTLEADGALGAACSKLVLAPRFLELSLSAPAFVPGTGDSRELAVMLRDVVVEGRSCRRDAHFGRGGWGIEHDRDGIFEWASGSSVLRVPVGEDQPTSVTLRLQAERTKDVVIDGGAGQVTVVVGRRACDVVVPVAGTAYDVVNNVGSILYEDGAGADRGWLERDLGQFDEPSDVFAWCGGGVLLRKGYLTDAGLFDEDFFLYYEDTDLAWRGRALGWGYRTAPGAVARHVHAASSDATSPLFAYYVERNRLLMLVKNAPRAMAWREVWRFVLVTASYARRDVVLPVLRARRPTAVQVRRRVGSFLGFVRLLPRMLAKRRGLRRRQRVADRELVAWFVAR